MWRNFRHFLYSATGSRAPGVVAEPDGDLERGLGGSIAARHEVDDPPCDQLRLTLDAGQVVECGGCLRRGGMSDLLVAPLPDVRA